MFGALKDSLTSSAAKSMLASRLTRYGTLLDLRIQSRDKRISVELQLEGEERSVIVDIEKYRIFTEGNETVVIISSVTASRIWLQNLLEDLVVGKPLTVPAIVSLALGKPE